MNRAAEWALALVAAVLLVAFLSAVAGGPALIRGTGFAATADARYFHAGKTPAAVEDGGCGAAGCHVGMPHAKERTHAAFRNMHVRFVACLVCHGRDSRKSWSVGPPAPGHGKGARDGGLPRNRWTLSAPVPPVDREKAHRLLGPALGCRGCHSAEGYRELGAKGAAGLPAGFVDPVALRMIEEGAKQWIPDTMR